MKRLGYWLILVCGVAIGGFIVFLSALSVWIGAAYQERDGYWMPILAGTLAGGLVISLFWRVSKHIYSRRKRTDSLGL